MSEIFSHGVGFAYDSKIFKEKGIELVDNTPEEIKDLVIEMIEYLEFNKKLSPESEELQKSFKKLYATNIKRFSKESDGKNVLLMGGKTKTKTTRKNVKKETNKTCNPICDLETIAKINAKITRCSLKPIKDSTIGSKILEIGLVCTKKC